MQKLFKNRITQEDVDTINRLKKTDIEMNYNDHKKITTSNTPEGLFFITLQPNCYVDEITLESDFRFILCLFYRWRYGSKWYKRKYLQYQYEGIIEQQNWKNHIHFKIFDKNENMEELAIFLGYIKAVFKQLYPKASFDFQRVYDVDGTNSYMNYDKKKKRTIEPIYISNIAYNY